MNTKLRIKRLMQQTGMDLQTLSRKSNISLEHLSGIQEGRVEPNDTTLQRINTLARLIGLCPECISMLHHQGGCQHCVCGWSQCG